MLAPSGICGLSRLDVRPSSLCCLYFSLCPQPWLRIGVSCRALKRRSCLGPTSSQVIQTHSEEGMGTPVFLQSSPGASNGQLGERTMASDNPLYTASPSFPAWTRQSCSSAHLEHNRHPLLVLTPIRRHPLSEPSG